MRLGRERLDRKRGKAEGSLSNSRAGPWDTPNNRGTRNLIRNILVSVRRVLESYESYVIQEWWPDSRGVTDVDEQEPRPLRPQQVAISERSDGRRMGTGRTADTAGQDWRWQAHGDHAGGCERPDVHSLDRLSVARDSERPAAEKLGLRLLRSVDI